MTGEVTANGDRCQPILVDGHVHLYDCYRWDRFIDAAASSFDAAARQLGIDAGVPCCLMLAETSRDDAFRRLRDRPQTLEPSPWTLRPAGEAAAVIAEHGERRIAIVAGRQIVTAEGLEVLALMVDAEFADGRTIDETIADARARGALPVLPWGVGKWQGRRGRVIHRVLEAAATGDLLVGDNGHRPTFWPRPRQFSLAEAKGIAVLPGSDPLPLSWQQTRVAGYGFAITAAYDDARPADSLRRALLTPRQTLTTFGRRDSLVTFVRTQVAMRRRPRSTSGSDARHRDGDAAP